MTTNFQARMNASYTAADYCCGDPDCCMPAKNNALGQLATRVPDGNQRLVTQYRPPSVQLLRQEQQFLSPGQRPLSIRTSSPRPPSQRSPSSVQSQPTSSPRPLSQRTPSPRPLPNNTNPLGPGGSNQSIITADKVALWESINGKNSGIVFDQPNSTPSPGGTTLKRSQSMSSSMQKTILENQRIANERLLQSERFRMSLSSTRLQTDRSPVPPPPPSPSYTAEDPAHLDQRSRSRSSPGHISSPTSTVNRLSTPSPPRQLSPPPPPPQAPLPPPIAAPSTPPLSLRPDSIPVSTPSLPVSKSGSPTPKYGKNPPWAENRSKEVIKPPDEVEEFNPPPPPKEAEYGWTEQDDVLPPPPQPSLELENIYQALQSFHYASDVDLTRIDPQSLRDLFLLRDR